jgi:hypothetical protein
MTRSKEFGSGGAISSPAIWKRIGSDSLECAGRRMTSLQAIEPRQLMGWSGRAPHLSLRGIQEQGANPMISIPKPSPLPSPRSASTTPRRSSA